MSQEVNFAAPVPVPTKTPEDQAMGMCNDIVDTLTWRENFHRIFSSLNKKQRDRDNKFAFQT